jgi:hypothetical protein
MRITSGGNVLIGKTNDRLRLTVSGSDSNAPTLGTASGTAIFANNAGSTEYGMNFGVASTGYGWIQQHRFDGTSTVYPLVLQPSGGNVLIGTTTDNSHKLQIGSTSSDRTSLSFSNTTTTRRYEVGLHGSSGTFPNRFFIFDDFANGYVFTIRASSVSRFHGPLETNELTSESATKLATINGNVLIGTTTDTSDKLRVNGNTFTDTITTLRPDTESKSSAWRLGLASSGTITPDRLIRISVGGLEYFIPAREA